MIVYKPANLETGPTSVFMVGRKRINNSVWLLLFFNIEMKLVQNDIIIL